MNDGCVRCGAAIEDEQRCRRCGLTSPGDPASAVWTPAPGFGAVYGGNLRDPLGGAQ